MLTTFTAKHLREVTPQLRSLTVHLLHLLKLHGTSQANLNFAINDFGNHKNKVKPFPLPKTLIMDLLFKLLEKNVNFFQKRCSYW